MPHFPLDQALTDSADGAESATGPYRALLLSDTGGLTKFGAFIEILPPRLCLLDQTLARA
ncbi:hypothetical protein [Pseudotabrizicola sediminis]|uniref:hypothetical protein n=1 Tax=Pseudotabrizicola sediminis TaxID=2486418 RepID=UPI001FDA3552|nr:hypothetical protein [Pseudotabrizicola sediminis]